MCHVPWMVFDENEVAAMCLVAPAQLAGDAEVSVRTLNGGFNQSRVTRRAVLTLALPFMHMVFFWFSFGVHQQVMVGWCCCERQVPAGPRLRSLQLGYMA